MRVSALVFVLAVVVSMASLSVDALKNDLKVKHDKRNAWFVDNFGFAEGGVLALNLSNLALIPALESPANPEKGYQVGIIIQRTRTDNSEFVEESAGACLFDVVAEAKAEEPKSVIAADITLPLYNESQWSHYEYTLTVGAGEGGLYNVYFVNCEDAAVTFEMNLVCKNPTGYLAVGDAPLPNVYLVCAFIFIVLLGLWIAALRVEGAVVFVIHHLMTFVLVLKIFTLLTLSIKYHYLRTTGEGNGWAIVYYIFAILKGIFLFGVIVLIGSGWAFVKPFLTDKDKRIFLVVIPLQVLDNIALVIVDEMAPGSQAWLSWYDILRVVDIICCGAILFPIVSSIKHLREAAASDGKAARNMAKLKLFRQFYIYIVAYIYFTRIVIYLLDATLPYTVEWISPLSGELASVLFFGVTGYNFRPVKDNPYLHVGSDDEGGDGAENGGALPLDDM